MATPEQLEVRRLAQEASKRLNKTPLEATRLALEAYICRLRRVSMLDEGKTGPLCVEEVEAAATILRTELGDFTNDELLDELFGKDAIIIEPHSIKLEVGKIMRSLGFELIQVRRRRCSGRILAWCEGRSTKSPESLDAEVSTAL